MKRGWMIVLLLSVGLNVGLGLNLLRRDAVAPVSMVEATPEEAPDQAQIERFMRRRLDRMSDELHLDEPQRAALWNLHRDVGRDVFGQRRALVTARMQLHEAYADSQADPQVIHATVRRLGGMQSHLDSLIVEVMLREREILTPEQRRHYHSLFPLGPERHPRHAPPDSRRGPRHGRQRVE